MPGGVAGARLTAAPYADQSYIGSILILHNSMTNMKNFNATNIKKNLSMEMTIHVTEAGN